MIVKQCKEFYWSGNKEDDGNVDSVENDEEVEVVRDTERGMRGLWEAGQSTVGTGLWRNGKFFHFK